MGTSSGSCEEKPQINHALTGTSDLGLSNWEKLTSDSKLRIGDMESGKWNLDLNNKGVQ